MKRRKFGKKGMSLLADRLRAARSEDPEVSKIEKIQSDAEVLTAVPRYTLDEYRRDLVAQGGHS